MTSKKESCFENYNKSCFDFTPTLENITLDKSALLYESGETWGNLKLKIIDGRLVLCAVPYFYIKIADGESGKLAIPEDWVFENSTATSFDSEETIVAALEDSGANGIPVWQSYCLGLDPQDAQSVVLCIPAPDQPAEAGAFKFMTNVAVPEELTGAAVTASLDRKSGGGWVQQETCTVEYGTPVVFTASADPGSALSFFA